MCLSHDAFGRTFDAQRDLFCQEIRMEQWRIDAGRPLNINSHCFKKLLMMISEVYSSRTLHLGYIVRINLIDVPEVCWEPELRPTIWSVHREVRFRPAHPVSGTYRRLWWLCEMKSLPKSVCLLGDSNSCNSYKRWTWTLKLNRCWTVDMTDIMERTLIGKWDLVLQGAWVDWVANGKIYWKCCMKCRGNTKLIKVSLARSMAGSFLVKTTLDISAWCMYMLALKNWSHLPHIYIAMFPGNAREGAAWREAIACDHGHSSTWRSKRERQGWRPILPLLRETWERGTS